MFLPATTRGMERITDGGNDLSVVRIEGDAPQLFDGLRGDDSLVQTERFEYGVRPREKPLIAFRLGLRMLISAQRRQDRQLHHVSHTKPPRKKFERIQGDQGDQGDHRPRSSMLKRVMCLTVMTDRPAVVIDHPTAAVDPCRRSKSCCRSA